MRKILVACRRHTGVNIACHIYKVVGAIPGLKGSTTRFCVTDNAPNMLSAVPRMTKKIDKGLGCFDHLLNLVMKDTNKADPTIADAIKVIFAVLNQNFQYFCNYRSFIPLFLLFSKTFDTYFHNFCFRNAVSLPRESTTVLLTNKGSEENARICSMTPILWNANTGKSSLM